MTAESVIRRTKLPALAAALALAAPAAFAEDGITNIISSTTVTNIGTYNVGSNGSFNALVLTNAGVLRVTGNGVIGNSSTSSNNYAIVTGAGSLWNNSSSVYIGNTGSFNRLTIANGGRVESGNVFWGYNASSSNNSVLVTDVGSAWSGSWLLVGCYGSSNSLTVANGGIVSGSPLIGEYAGANDNVVTVTGAGSILTNATISVGSGGARNRLVITDGGKAYSSGSQNGFGSGANSNAIVVSGAGSVWSNNGSLEIGNYGSFNQMIITNGGVVACSGSGQIGIGESGNYPNLGHNNAVTVTGTGSVWSASFINVGYNGSANQLTITNGGKVFGNGKSFIGWDAGAGYNAVTVSGAGSVWSNTSQVYVGYNGGDNHLTIADGGAVYNSDAYVGYKNYYNQATVSGSGSVWNIMSNLFVGTWATSTSLIITNGGAVYDVNGSIADGGGRQNIVVVSGAGSIWSNSSSLQVGGGGDQNQLIISNGGKVQNTVGYIGYIYEASYNTVVVTGVGSVWTNSGPLFVGCSGTFSQLTISSGAKVYNTTGYIGCDGWASPNSGWDYNTGVVTGIGSLWNNSGDLYIGATSSWNNLIVSDAGVVVSATGYIGYDRFGHDNTVLITGSNSAWQNSGDLYVGHRGHDNQLTIASGGSVANANAYIGYNAAYSNPDFTPDAINSRVIVAGTGSVWSNAGSVFIGVGSTNNSLTITNGGLVINQNGFIGISTNGNANAVLVSGSGSLWSNSGGLYLGVTGSLNRLTVSNGGVVIASNLIVGVTANSTGNVVTVSGGKLYATNSVASGSLDVRRGTFALNSGTVVVNQLYLTNNASSIMTFSAGLLQSGGSTVSNGVVFTVGDGVQSATLDLLGGTHTFANGLKLNTNASLIGNGGIFGNVTNFSIIAPGHSVGVINITGGLTLQGTAELDMELAGPGTNDVLDISGLLAASGGLRVTFANGYTGNPGDTFDLLNFGSLSGAFSQTNLPALGDGLYWNTSNLYTLGQIAIAGVPEPGVSALLALGVAMLARRRRRR